MGTGEPGIGSGPPITTEASAFQQRPPSEPQRGFQEKQAEQTEGAGKVREHSVSPYYEPAAAEALQMGDLRTFIEITRGMDEKSASPEFRKLAESVVNTRGAINIAEGFARFAAATKNPNLADTVAARYYEFITAVATDPEKAVKAVASSPALDEAEIDALIDKAVQAGILKKKIDNNS